ncbi:SPFH domain-containing protein [Brachybacterium sp. J153]|uniref:SPFH domain-containing protein n=1 Tax=Brachybacterium sp. J153 TaxID=3116488 RepID=UPI002E79C61D|nr:SPFH domain-containing protein [Brachybacterium sp. J153]MEE1619349.1 SPFH domain-containing protein [Brachybacterium sp. J153]
MGFIQAFKGAVGGMLADQWKDFLTVPSGLQQTAALFPAVPQGTNSGRGSNTRGSENVITNGSKIIVPQGYGLITVVDGRATGLVTEAGGYEFTDSSPDSRSVFAGDGMLASTVQTSWERFKFGGRPSSQQLAFFVNLKEIPDNRFGTQSEIYWDDAYLNSQVGAVTRGSYTLRIVDPLLFVHNFVPATFISANAGVFDFSDPDNAAGNQLFREVVGSLAAAFSRYTNDPDKGNRITKIQGDSVGFAQSLSAAVEEGYRWSTDRGLAIVKTAIVSIEYDANTRALLTEVQKADALSGARSQSYLNQSVARGVQAAGENGGGTGLAMFGAGAGAVGGLVNPVQQTGAPQQQAAPAAPAAPAAEDPVAKLAQYKHMLDQGLISEADYEAAKKAALGL